MLYGLQGQQSWEDNLFGGFLVARQGKMLNEHNRYYEAQYVRWLNANTNLQDLTVLNEILHIPTVLKQCTMQLQTKVFEQFFSAIINSNLLL